MTSDALILVAVAVAAFGLGWLNLFALRATVDAIAHRQVGAWLALTSGPPRLLLLAGLLCLLATDHWERWIAVLAGITAARVVSLLVGDPWRKRMDLSEA